MLIKMLLVSAAFCSSVSRTVSAAERDDRKLRVVIFNGGAPKETVYTFEESINKKLDVTGTSFDCVVTPMGAPPPLKFTGWFLKCHSTKKELEIETSANCRKGSSELDDLTNRASMVSLTFADGKDRRTIFIGCSKTSFLN